MTLLRCLRLLAFLLLTAVLPAGAQQWQDTRLPVASEFARQPGELAATPGSIHLCHARDGLWRATDADTTWQRVEPARVTYQGATVSYCGRIVASGRSVVVSLLDTLLVSRDEGATWAKAPPISTVLPGARFFPTVERFAASGSYVYALATYRIPGELYERRALARFDLATNTWSRLYDQTDEPAAPGAPPKLGRMRTFAVDGTNVYAVPLSQLDTLWVSADEGRTWRRGAHRFVLFPFRFGDAVYVSTTVPQGFHRTRDGAATWETVPVNLGTARNPGETVVRGARLYATNNRCALYTSLDPTTGWTPIVAADLCTSNEYTTDNDFDVTTRYAYFYRASEGRAYRTSLGVYVSAPAPEVDRPRTVTLAPNPASDQATVRFDLPTPGQVRVTLHDVLGRHVATVAEGAFGVGPHVLAVDTAPLTPGVYLVRLQRPGDVVTQPFVVQR